MNDNKDISHHTVDYRNLFQAVPECCLVVDVRDAMFTILDANARYLEVTGMEKNIIGKPIAEAFSSEAGTPDEQTINNVLAAFRQVVHKRATVDMQIQRYDLVSTASGKTERRFWKAQNIPVFDDGNNLLYILHVVKDVTQFVMLEKSLQTHDATMQKQILDAVITTQEMERLEISRELHDNINQVLNTARLYLEHALGKEELNASMVRSACELVQHAMDGVRALSSALHTTSADETNLVQELERILKQVMDLRPIHVMKTIDLPHESMIESKVKNNIVRIIQEQLSNVMKHSNARNLFFDLRFIDNKLELTIRDDGKGFDLKASPGGMGLRNIRSRVAMLDGKVDIISSPGDGCKILVHIPVNRHSNSDASKN